MSIDLQNVPLPRFPANGFPLGGDDKDLTATHIFTNKEIVECARARPKKFSDFVEYLIITDRPLNMVNIATVLYSTGKLRMVLGDFYSNSEL